MEKIIFSKSFIDFIKKTDCKVAQILYRLNQKNYLPLITTSLQVNYLTFRNDGTISYLPAGKELKYNDAGDWGREGRQNGKPSKIVRKLFTDRAIKLLQFKDADFECFTNAYKANFNEDGYTFELLPNNQIPSIYEMDRASGEGSLNNSCMNGNSEYLDIYKNCDKLQILILKNNAGLLCGRSLVWKLTEDITLDKFLSFAAGKYWRKKDYKSYDNKQTFVNLLGEEICKNFVIYTDTDFDSYPYIDTFQYGEDGSLNNSGGQYSYNNTDGTRDGGEDDHEGEIYDEINDEYISEYDATYITAGERRYRDRYCHSDNCVSVGDEYYYEDDDNIVEVGNTWYTKDSDELCEVGGEYELRDNCTYCERDDQYYLSDDCVYCEDDEEDVLRDEAIEIDGNWYHQDSEKIVKVEGEYYLIDSDEIELKDGKYCLIEVEEETN